MERENAGRNEATGQGVVAVTRKKSDSGLAREEIPFLVAVGASESNRSGAGG